jgi:hypothetical protein
MNPWDNDKQFEIHQIESVTGSHKHFVIRFTTGLSLLCPSDFIPEPRMEVKVFGRGFGHPVRGLIIDNRAVYYSTQAEHDAAAEEERKKFQREMAAMPKRPPVTLNSLTFSHEMAEISGFGGGYEACCRAMVLAGVDWGLKNPTLSPQTYGFANVIGVHLNANHAAKQLEEAIVSATYEWEGKQCVARAECTGAMLQAAMQHSITASKMGWKNYVGFMVAAQAKRGDE